MQWFTLKDKEGNLSRIPIPSGDSSGHSSTILQKPESPENKSRHARHIGSVLARKTKEIAKSAIEKKREHDIKRKEIVKQHYEAVDKILDDKELTPRQKFRKIQRYVIEHRKQMTDYQIHMFNQDLRELDLQHKITPDEVESEVKTVNDRNPKPVTFAELDKDVQTEKDRNPLPVTFTENMTPSQDEDALNKLAKEFQRNKAKEGLTDRLQAEISTIEARENK